ncbi:hypothetical protein EHQ58_05695 [Leptospira ognonensis]|uniref:Lipoprotein n=1 Tax=Leptospira ognonensis TaxID=2484945 RepID=A0A4R9K979_9LEPT|nr:hypothetical protein [Leptospira ognonensis]TGL61268.1 hypothetical protein EHQ58_05695 [Leptospira ognonensis]
MKRNIIKFTGIAMISALALTACHPDRVKEEIGLAAILSLTIKNAASGNCAISLNLGTLYSGAIMQAAISSTTTFTEAEFTQASGTSIGTGQNYTTYASVPYNVKYDAFIRGGGTYDSTARNTDIATGKASVDAASYLGIAAATCSAAGTTSGATLQAILDAHLATFTTAEQTSLGAVFTAAGGSVTGVRTAFAGGCGVIAGALAATYTAFGGSTATATAYQARQAYANGTGILACARIPRSSCTFTGLTTADRAAAFTSIVKAFDAVNNNTDCRKPNSDFSNSMIRGAFTGTPRNTIISGFTTHTYAFVVAHPTTDVVTPISEGSTFGNNKIFPETAYPVSPALSNISAAFNVAFPLTIGTTKQDESSIKYYKASNINLSQVDACEGLSLSGYGPISEIAIGSTNIANRKELTSTKEIAYAFSAENTAAALYATTRGAVQGTATATELDAIACNNSFRSKYVISQAIGGGKLPVLNSAISGDGGSTSNLTTCLYGGTAAGRTTSGSLLATTSLAGIGSCPAGASAGAAKFGDSGLDKLTAFPNNE